MKIICMIPARLGSQRLLKKNLQILNDKNLIEHAIDKAKKSKIFDEIWVNSESDLIGSFAIKHNVGFHKRPDNLADNTATSEDFVYEFLKKHNCDYLIQLHSIAPLLKVDDIINFVNYLLKNELDVLLGVEDIQIECVYENNPINFNYLAKKNSQDLIPIKKISWSISAWKRDVYINAYEEKKCATYYGKIGYFPLSKFATHVIKTIDDFEIAKALFNLT